MLALKRLTAAEYFDLDAQHEGKLELWFGVPVAMAGAYPRHNILCGNVLAALHGPVRAKGCATFPSDQRVRLPEGNYVHPDASVACGPQYDEARPPSLLNPVLIVEVISTSTEQIDRRDKLDAYMRHASLHGYWLFEQDRRFVTVYTRQGDDWTVRTLHGAADTLTCAPLDVTLMLADLYEGVPLDDLTG